MRTDELDYELLSELIAQRPARVRSESRLLVLERGRGGFIDSRFDEIGEFLRGGDCLVLNDTKVLPARFFARRGSGGKVECLFLEEVSGGLWEVTVKGSRRLRVSEVIYLKDAEGRDFCEAEVVEKKDKGKCLLRVVAAGSASQLRLLCRSESSAEAILERIGFAPLPPYVKRGADLEQASRDKVRYQTVYAERSGAVAAPTAGLHFTDELIERLRVRGIIFAYVTLHVGEGTFRPVTAERLEEHKMHEERFSIDAENARLVNEAIERRARVIAVGTTSVRVLETAAAGAKVQAGSGATRLFITPGYKFKIVDGMVTNFHLPRSTLLALVAAFAGLETILAAYRHAVERRYRFYSYGDAMLIL